jgi:hypothetical protein
MHIKMNPYVNTIVKNLGGNKKAVAGQAFGEGDMERLRAAIQVLVQHTGPLGTCMDYIQEDISLMTGIYI